MIYCRTNTIVLQMKHKHNHNLHFVVFNTQSKS